MNSIASITRYPRCAYFRLPRRLAVALAAIASVVLIAPTLAAPLLDPGDPIVGGQLQGTRFVPGTSGSSGNRWPGAESPQDAINGWIGGGGEKYLNFAKFNTGFVVRPDPQATVVNSIRLWVANDAVGRDPASYQFYGSNSNSISAPFPISSFTLIASGGLSLPGTRDTVFNTSGYSQTVSFSNSTSYRTYILIFPTIKNSGENSMQISEVEFYGSVGLDNRPVANAGGPYTINEGQTLNLNGSLSTDDNGITLYEWDVDNNGSFEVSSTSPFLSRTWAQLEAIGVNDNGSRSVRLRVRDTIGQTNIDGAPLTINNVAPAAGFSAPPLAANEDTSVSFTFTADDPSSADDAAGFFWTVNWGDGTPIQTFSGTSPQTRSHTWAQPRGSAAQGVLPDTPPPYTVTVRARDKNFATSAPATTQIHIRDITPPVLVDMPKDIILTAPLGAPGDNVSWTDPTAVDNFDPSPVISCDATPGDFFPIGTNTVTCTATDASGNASMASFDIIVLEAIENGTPVSLTLDPIALRGDALPGAGTGGIPANATWSTIAHFFINNPGEILANAAIRGDGVNTGNNKVLIAGDPGALSVIAREGDDAGLGGPTFVSFFDEALGDDGKVAFEGRLGGGDHANYYYDGVLIPVTRKGDPEPGASGEVFENLGAPGYSSYHGTFATGTLAASGTVDGTNNLGIWGSNSILKPLMREGDPVPIPALGGATYGQPAGNVVANDAGDLGFIAFLQTGSGAPAVTTRDNSAIFAGNPDAGSLQLVAREGQSAPGTSNDFKSFLAISINSAGDAAFEATLATGSGPAVNSANNCALYYWNKATGLKTLIARENAVVPCLPVTTVLFNRFQEIYINDAKEVIFRASMRGAVSSSNDESLWKWYPADGSLHLIYREGDPANSIDGAFYSHIVDLACNRTGAVAFTARLQITGDTTRKNNLGLWVENAAVAAPTLMMRKRDVFTPDTDEVPITLISIASPFNGVGGCGGYGNSINDSADIATKIGYKGGRGIFILDSAP